MKKGKLIVLSGPSGVGKGTIRENIQFNNYTFSVSSTTRLKRVGESEGEDYHFITKEKFEQKIKNNEMLEYAEFVDNYYGTDEEIVLNLLEQGKNVLLEIECVGALQVIDKIPEVLSIFIIPPSIEELKQRLIKRGTENNQKINKRIAKAQEEMKLKHKYKYVIINDNLNSAVKQLDKILKEEINEN